MKQSRTNRVLCLCALCCALAGVVGCEGEPNEQVKPSMVMPGTFVHPLNEFAFISHGDNDCGPDDCTVIPRTVCTMMENSDTVAIVATRDEFEVAEREQECSGAFHITVNHTVDVWAVASGVSLPTTMDLLFIDEYCLFQHPDAVGTYLVSIRHASSPYVVECVPIDMSLSELSTPVDDEAGYYSQLPRTFEELVAETRRIELSFEDACGRARQNIENFESRDETLASLNECPLRDLTPPREDAVSDTPFYGEEGYGD